MILQARINYFSCQVDEIRVDKEIFFRRGLRG